MTSNAKSNVSQIPFNKVDFLGKELAYIAEAIQEGHISGDGRFTKQCSQFLERELGIKKCLLTTSCTDALEMAAILLDIKPGDEVIVPSFTFVSTVNAFVLRGGVPRFVDVDEKTLNINPKLIEQNITPKTKAIVPVHYAGVGCEMDEINRISNQYNLAVIEDNAHGLFGKYKGKYLGTFGAMATQSFHETKNFTCGEGGALLINSENYIARAEILRDKGTNRKNFFRGLVDKYTWVDIGSSFLPSDILSAFLYAQLESFEEVQERRSKIWNTYYQQLQEWAVNHGVGLPFVPDHCEQAFHMFYIIAPNLDFRRKLIKHLSDQDIYAVFHYLPLHLSQMGIEFGGKPGDCPVTESVTDRLLRLPFYSALSEENLDRVIQSVLQFRP